MAPLAGGHANTHAGNLGVKRMKVRDLRAGTVCRTKDGWWGVLGTWHGGGSRYWYRRFDAWDTGPFAIGSDEWVDVPSGRKRPSDGVRRSQVVVSILAPLYRRLREVIP